jgi:predicted ATP-dependent endonuclease of OLD family
MQLVSKIKIAGFRSIREDTLDSIESFASLAGLNNSGKSNYLRALNLFFNGEVEPGVKLDTTNDYYRPDIIKQKKKKEIRIGVTFNLPDHFKFRKKLEEVKDLLNPPSFTITKVWGKKEVNPRIYLGDRDDPLRFEDQQKVEQFLSLITFRYIPNRVLPIDIIKRERQALRDVLIRRVSKKKSQSADATFRDIANTSKRLIDTLHEHLQDTIPNFEDIRLATPTSFAEMIFAFGYKLREQGFEIDDSMQGSGIQSLLMLDTLYLIDKDYFQQFGWKQAAVWAIEEPESSLHFSLEASVARFLSQITSQQGSRLQIVATTHSEALIQHSDKCYLIQKTENGSKSHTEDIGQIIEKVSKLGVSSWTHPLLQFPLSPLILCEGKRDMIFLNKAIELLDPKALGKIRISYLEKISLSNTGETGGKDNLANYIKSNARVIKNRSNRFPVLVILDWDAKNKEQELKKPFLDNDPFIVCTWPEGEANLKLSEEFRGFERFLSDRIIGEVRSKNENIIFENNNICTVRHQDYEEFKKIASEIIENDLREEDLINAKAFVENVIRSALV